jgi:hypothetical protein
MMQIGMLAGFRYEYPKAADAGRSIAGDGLVGGDERGAVVYLLAKCGYFQRGEDDVTVEAENISAFSVKLNPGSAAAVDRGSFDHDRRRGGIIIEFEAVAFEAGQEAIDPVVAGGSRDGGGLKVPGVVRASALGHVGIGVAERAVSGGDVIARATKEAGIREAAVGHEAGRLIDEQKKAAIADAVLAHSEVAPAHRPAVLLAQAVHGGDFAGVVDRVSLNGEADLAQV